ncbi:Bystin family protein [Cryptosporidium felis]|nr:Bystin family protein [Cryptosporidium felis]
MPKLKKSKLSNIRNPLHIDIESAKCPYSKPKKSESSKFLNRKLHEDSGDEELVPSKLPESLGKRILEEANRQLLFDLNENEIHGSHSDPSSSEIGTRSDLPIDSTGFVFVDENHFNMSGAELDDSYWNELLKSREGEGQTFKSSVNRMGVVNLILTKIQTKELNGLSKAVNSSPSSQIPDKVIQVYSSIGEWLGKYKSGKLPKAFTIIPKLENWEEILHLTNPFNWSPNAMNEAIKIFCSNLSPKDSLKFYSQILYPTIRTNISQNYGKLNYHYYQALKKAMFKPASWFKGILLPLAEDETCTVKEAIIIGSILSKVSIPVLHTAAAIIKLSQIKTWNTCQTHFIMVLLCKKYSMPKKAIDELVNNFAKFDNSLDNNRKVLFSCNNINLNSNVQTNSVLPVTWHKTLLVFVQRYKFEFTSSQIKRLSDLVKNQYHYLISPEIIRELSHSLIGIPNEEIDIAMS